MKKHRPKPPKLRKQNVVLPPTAKSAKEPAIKLPDSMGIEWNIPHQLLHQRSLFVATPMYGGQCTGTFARCMDALAVLCRELKIPYYAHYLFNESLIPRARNYCCDEFLRAKVGPPPRKIVDEEGKPILDEQGKEVFEPDNRPYFTHMLFIDADISFRPEDVICMLAMSEGDKDVICAPYPKKCISWEKVKAIADMGLADVDPNILERFIGDYVFNPVPLPDGRVPLNQPIEILEGGTGFMMMQRATFAKFDAKYPCQAYKPDHVRTSAFDGSRPIMAYFDCPIDRGYSFDDMHDLIIAATKGEDIKDRAAALLEIESKASMRYLSEDYMFCQYLRKAGGKVWLLPWVRLQHTGTYIFGGSLVDLLLTGQNPTADPSKLGGKK